MLESEVTSKFRRRLLREFLDMILMCELKTRPLSGYNALSFIHNKYDYLVSSGTVYSLLYSLEREGLIEGRKQDQKRMFKLTSEGEEMVDVILAADNDLFVLAKKLINVA